MLTVLFNIYHFFLQELAWINDATATGTVRILKNVHKIIRSLQLLYSWFGKQ